MCVRKVDLTISGLNFSAIYANVGHMYNCVNCITFVCVRWSHAGEQFYRGNRIYCRLKRISKRNWTVFEVSISIFPTCLVKVRSFAVVSWERNVAGDLSRLCCMYE
jgi:hypothetical protein